MMFVWRMCVNGPTGRLNQLGLGDSQKKLLFTQLGSLKIHFMVGLAPDLKMGGLADTPSSVVRRATSIGEAASTLGQPFVNFLGG
jgi:hypothetical protein